MVRAQPLSLSGSPGEACYVHTPVGADLIILTGGPGLPSWSLSGPRGSRPAVPFAIIGPQGSAAPDDWTGDALACLVRADGRLAAYEVTSLSHAETSLLSASAPLESIALWPVGGGLAGQIVARCKTIVRLHVPWPWDQVRVNDIHVPQEDRESPDPSFQLPCEGTFRLLITAGI